MNIDTKNTKLREDVSAKKEYEEETPRECTKEYEK